MSVRLDTLKVCIKKPERVWLIIFTGIDSSYETPLEPEIIVGAGVLGVEEYAQTIYKYLLEYGCI